jgi:hypothetical protein
MQPSNYFTENPGTAERSQIPTVYVKTSKGLENHCKPEEYILNKSNSFTIFNITFYCMR